MRVTILKSLFHFHLVVFVTFISMFVTLPLLPIKSADAQVEEKSKRSGPQTLLDDEALRSYLEAVGEIEQRALFPDRAFPGNTMFTAMLKTYLAAKDPFSDFLTPREYTIFKNNSGEEYVGVGLEIERSRTGEILCFPDPAGPAAKAGIAAGDRLITINDLPVRSFSLPTLATMAAGVAGSQVTLEVIKPDGSRKLLAVRREAVTIKTIFKESYRSMPVIHLQRFDSNTKRELDFLLTNWNKAVPLIIDLRGNSGGDFHSAIDSAMLFLKKGENIAFVRGKKERQSYQNNVSRPPFEAPVFLWQDQATASAAEIFIAALTENSHAISIGGRTFGKGTRQDIIELKSGAALILTTGYLQTPRGVEFDGKGIDPTHPIGSGSQTGAYLDKVNELLRSKKGKE